MIKVIFLAKFTIKKPKIKMLMFSYHEEVGTIEPDHS